MNICDVSCNNYIFADREMNISRSAMIQSTKPMLLLCQLLSAPWHWLTEQLKSLKFNLNKNAKLRRQLLRADVSAEQLVAMSSADLKTDEEKRKLNLSAQAQADERRLDWGDKNRDAINQQCGITNNVGMFECGRCKSNNTEYFQKQTRSADEPMTTFVTCKNCQKKWRFC
jgi:transcription elongation factor S-II